MGVTPAGTSEATVEVQFLLDSPQGALTPRSLRDFSSNSQTSQGFHPVAASGAVHSDSSTSGSAMVKTQKVPSLTNLTMEEEEEEVTPRPDQQTGAWGQGEEVREGGRYMCM